MPMQCLHNYTGQCELVCFSGEHLADPVKPQLKHNGAIGQHWVVGPGIAALPLGHASSLWPCSVA